MPVSIIQFSRIKKPFIKPDIIGGANAGWTRGDWKWGWSKPDTTFKFLKDLDI